MSIVIAAVLLVLIIEIGWKPRLDKTPDGDVLLWYGRVHREWVKLF